MVLRKGLSCGSQKNGQIVIQNQDEGNAIPQSLLSCPDPLMFAAWRGNVKEIVDGAH